MVSGFASPTAKATGHPPRKFTRDDALEHRAYRVGKALRGYPVALRSRLCDGVLDVYFDTKRIGWINERRGQ